MYNIRDWRVMDPMLPQRAYRASRFIDPDYVKSIWTEYNMFMSAPRLYVANALGIRYFIMPRGYDPNDPSEKAPGSPDFKRLAYADGLGLWEAQGVPGFAYLSDNVWAVPDEDSAAHWMQSLTWDKMREYAAEVEAPESSIVGTERTQHTPGSGPAGSVNVTHYAPGQIVLDVEAKKQALLVVAESYYPGWRATVDRQPANIMRANFLSQGVTVAPGKHTVEFSYEPDSFRYGALISLGGLASLAALAGWAVLGRKKKTEAGPVVPTSDL
jgi:hypothetical protein